SSLRTRKYRAVQNSGHLLRFSLRRFLSPGVLEVLPHQDHSAARATQGLMGRRRDDVAMRQRVIQQSSGDQSGRMSDVSHYQGLRLIGNGTDTFISPVAGISRRAANDEPGLFSQRGPFHLIVVNAS